MQYNTFLFKVMLMQRYTNVTIRSVLDLQASSLVGRQKMITSRAFVQHARVGSS